MPKVQYNLRSGSRTLFRSTAPVFSTWRPQAPIEEENGPLAVFFARYTKFDYNPAKSATDEFGRLCKSKGWNRNEKKMARRGFQDALTMQFNNNYGTDVNDLTKWQALCAKLQMDPVPENLKGCREAARSKHVNLVDLVDNFSPQKTVHLFPNVLALSKYTNEEKKYFPRRNAHAGNLLKFLLRHIMNPELDRSRGECRPYTEAVVEAEDESLNQRNWL